MGHAALLISLAELFCIALCLASVSFACGTSMTLLTTLKNCFSECFLGLQVRKQSESNPLYDPTDDPKKFDFQPNFKPDTPLPGTPGTSSWSPETPLGHRTGPKPDFH